MSGFSFGAPATSLTNVTSDLTDILADLVDITDEVNKIDIAASDGLAGVEDSVAYRIAADEVHHHSFERWFGVANVPNAEIHVADRIGTTTTAFQVDAGNNTWGSWLQILGSSDTPADAGSVYFDGHRWIITAAEVGNAIYFVQVAAGASGAAALAAGTYSEFVVKPLTTNARSFPGSIQSERIPVGTKVWVRTWAVGENTATLNFFFGVHEYSG